MSDPLQELLMARTVQAGLKNVETQLRPTVEQGLAPGDRRFGSGPVAGARVTKSKPVPITVVRVTNPQVVAEWLVEHGYVDEVYPMPKPHVLKDVEVNSLKAGEPCGPGGELGIPGVEVVEVTPAPEFRVYADPEAVALVAQRWQELVGGRLPELLAREED